MRGGGARLAAAGTESQKHGEIDDKEDEGRTYTQNWNPKLSNIDEEEAQQIGGPGKRGLKSDGIQGKI